MSNFWGAVQISDGLFDWQEQMEQSTGNKWRVGLFIFLI